MINSKIRNFADALTKSVWDVVNFLYNSLYSLCFRFGAKRMLLSLWRLAVAEGGLYSVKAFSFSSSALHFP